MGATEVIVEPGRQDIVMTRVFDAPRELVFQAVTDPDLIPKWWGPRGYETVIDRAEVRTGGSWRFIHRDPGGNEHAFRGVYHDVVAPERLVFTFEYEGLPGHVLLQSDTFEEVEGGTRYVSVAVFQSVEDRDGMVRSGMEAGARDSMDRLDELLKQRAGG